MLLSSPQPATVFRPTNSVIYISCDSLLCLLSVELLYHFVYPTLFSAEACFFLSTACHGVFVSPCTKAKLGGRTISSSRIRGVSNSPPYLWCSHVDEHLIDWLFSHGNDGTWGIAVCQLELTPTYTQRSLRDIEPAQRNERTDKRRRIRC
jgi:hypothetical protein